MPDFSLEHELGGVVAGIDEAGRGPWAGPVVAAAALLDEASLPAKLKSGIDDSKQLSAPRRDELFEALSECAKFGVGSASVEEVDALNILRATHLAMARALDDLGTMPDATLVDGNRAPSLPCPVTCVVKGDGLSLSIAAASIVAKVTRDRLMTSAASEYPGYGWERNFGYGTKQHREALAKLGVTPLHRRSFAPIRALLSYKNPIRRVL